MNQDELEDDQERAAGRRTVLIYLGVGALAALATGYVMTAGIPSTKKDPAPTSVVTETKPAEIKAAETKAPEVATPGVTEQATTETKPAEPVQQAAAPETTSEAKTEANSAASEPAQATTQQPETQTAAAQPQTEVARPTEQQPVAEPAPAATAKVEPEPEPQQQAAVQPEAAAEPAPAAPQPAAVPASAPEATSPPKAEAPSFDTVRVEPTGDAVIAGRAEPGTEVMIKHNGTVIGKTVANAEGSFVFVPDKPLPSGSGTLSLESKLGGAVQTSEATVAVAVKEQAKGEALVAVVKPDEPTKIIQAPSAAASGPASSVVLDAVDYDATGNIIFSGRSKPGNAIRLYIDNALAGEVNADADGRWMFGGQADVAPGTHTLRADEIGSDGKVLSRVELPFLREEAAKVAAAEPAQTTVEPAAAPAAATAPATQDTAETTAEAVPAEAATGAGETQVAAAEPVAPDVTERVVIQPGNNLWRLSRSVYGKGVQYTVIYEANKDQIRNPDLIYPGQVFTLPKAP